MDHSKELTHLSLCTGYGGIDLGLKRVVNNVRTVAYVEIEAFQCANLVSKMEKGWLDAAPIWTNLKTFPWRSFRGKVDIISGGFPCQPFSSAGRRAGDEDPRHLWPHIKRGIEIVRPSIVFMENVEGIISSKLQSDQWNDPKGTSVLLHVLRELERVDYQATAGVFSAAEVGAPHQRKRVFIMGIQTNHNESSIKWKQEPYIFYPKGRGEEQHGLEPPRTTLVHPDGREQRSHNRNTVLFKKAETRKTNRLKWSSGFGEVPENQNLEGRKAQSQVGGPINGFTYRMELSCLYKACESRTDELRSLGNGVVPSTASRAFKSLFKTLANPKFKRS